MINIAVVGLPFVMGNQEEITKDWVRFFHGKFWPLDTATGWSDNLNEAVSTSLEVVCPSKSWHCELSSSMVKFLTIAPVTIMAALVMREHRRIKLVLGPLEGGWSQGVHLFSLRGKWKTLNVCRIIHSKNITVCESLSTSEYWWQIATGNACQKVKID